MTVESLEIDVKTGSIAVSDNGKTEEGDTSLSIDKNLENSYVRKLDFYLLPFLSLMYFFNAVDRSNLGNAKTDGPDVDLNFKGNEYSLLILLFYVPFGMCDLPLNLLTKLWSGRIMLPSLMVGWGSLALVQCAAKNFAGLLVIRLLLGVCEAEFFAGVVFYMTLFYTRGELGFRLAIFFGSALLAVAFSELISYGVFRISYPQVYGWMWLFIIEGGLTIIVGVATFWWLPSSPEQAWFLNNKEKPLLEQEALETRMAIYVWCIIAFTYPVAFATTSNSLLGMIVLAAVDVLTNKGVAYFSCFLMAAGAYTPSVLVHSWHNNNNLEENSRAATTGLLVGLGNLAGILSAATFRVEYAPAYIPTLITTSACNVVCIFFTLGLGLWMKNENRKKNREQGKIIRAEDVNTGSLADGEKSPQWRFFT